ncbi:hypothetical protein SAY87_026043 [Trapa incisa]|uniref:AP2/ERF domain-containing protein n=1 Tax=Trapa incisa TaxID=236973 RepID=A0AAN7JCR5_9MYRT|nr:hypothetical protein SAY87_026043 [Trapa incisa]
MAKPSIVKTMQSEEKVRDTDFKYTGVRKRKWGKWVSEIRLPNSRERIWLGSYDSAEKAARAFDAAQFCLRGSSARLNFPGSFPEIPDRHLTHEDVHTIATRFANSGPLAASRAEIPSEISLPTVTVSECSSDVTSLIRPDPVQTYPSSPSDSISVESNRTDICWPFLDFVVETGSETYIPLDYEIFPGFDDFSGDYYNHTEPITEFGQESSIANFGDGPDFMVFLCPATETAAN